MMAKKILTTFIMATLFVSGYPSGGEVKIRLYLKDLAVETISPVSLSFIVSYWKCMRDRMIVSKNVGLSVDKLVNMDTQFRHYERSLQVLLDSLYSFLLIKNGTELYLIRRPSNFQDHGPLSQLTTYFLRRKYVLYEDLETMGLSIEFIEKSANNPRCLEVKDKRRDNDHTSSDQIDEEGQNQDNAVSIDAVPGDDDRSVEDGEVHDRSGEEESDEDADLIDESHVDSESSSKVNNDYLSDDDARFYRHHDYALLRRFLPDVWTMYYQRTNDQAYDADDDISVGSKRKRSVTDLD